MVKIAPAELNQPLFSFINTMNVFPVNTLLHGCLYVIVYTVVMTLEDRTLSSGRCSVASEGHSHMLVQRRELTHPLWVASVRISPLRTCMDSVREVIKGA